MKRYWFKYQTCGANNEFFRPCVHARLSIEDANSVELPFILDTGAVTSWARKYVYARLFPNEFDQFEDNLTATGIKDASGKPLFSVKRSISISISLPSNPADKISFVEEVHFGDVDFNLLGQTAFEKIGGHFHNFPTSSKGRKFAIFTNNLIQNSGSPVTKPTKGTSN